MVITIERPALGLATAGQSLSQKKFKAIGAKSFRDSFRSPTLLATTPSLSTGCGSPSSWLGEVLK
jgi:hypothetical protein